jgi:hypothetical protein
LLASLPHSLVLNIFARLSPHTRLRCAEVCRAWRAALADGSLWTRLDLRVSAAAALTFSDRTLRHVSDALLRAAAARAAPAGGLQSLDVRGCSGITRVPLLAVLTDNAASLQTVHLGRAQWVGDMTLDEVEALLRVAPALRELDVCARVRCTSAEARRLLRGEPPFGPVRMRKLAVDYMGDDTGNDATVQHLFVALLADLAAARAVPCSLGLEHLPLRTPAALNAVVDAALFHRFSALSFYCCDLVPAAAPALARLLSSRTLTQLSIEDYERLLDAPAAAVLAAALRANTTLTSLRLRAGLWDDMGAATALLDAAAHSSLRYLSVSDNDAGAHAAEAGAALAALVAADAPALRKLEVKFCALGDVGMRAVAEALHANTHLRRLNVSYNDTTPAFAATHMLAAVRANASLCYLQASEFGADDYPNPAEAVFDELWEPETDEEMDD